MAVVLASGEAVDFVAAGAAVNHLFAGAIGAASTVVCVAVADKLRDCVSITVIVHLFLIGTAVGVSFLHLDHTF